MSEDDRLIAGRYRLGVRIGSGGMGVVWQAYDERLGRTVAVKRLLLPAYLAGAEAEEAKQRAMRESRIAARIQHPHVIAIYDVVEDEGHTCLVMEYLPSKSLSEVVEERGPLPPVEVAQIGVQAASALAAAHAVGVVHRDVKPGNVLLGDGDVRTVKIVDFGIARAAGDVTITMTGLISGTPAFLSPEVAKGDNATSASDVFSLGATLYAAIEGAPPFGRHDNAIALLHRVASGQINPPRQAGVMTPVLLRMLNPNPAGRPSMTEASRALEALTSSGGGTARDHTTFLPPVLPVLPRPGPTNAPPTDGQSVPAGESSSAGEPAEEPPTQEVAPADSAPADSSPDGDVSPQEAPFAQVISVDWGEASTQERPDTTAPPGDGIAPVHVGPAGPPTSRRTRAAVWIGALACVLALAGLAAAFALPTLLGVGDPTGAPTGKSDQGEKSEGATPDPSTTRSEPQRTPDRTPSPDASPSTTAKDDGKADKPGRSAREALLAYYRLMPDHPKTAYTWLTSRYRQSTSGSYANYRAWWSQFRSVEASVLSASGGNPATVVARVDYTGRDGRRFSEVHRYTLVRDGRRWLIDASTVVRG